jgi:hypothetical protein
MVGPPHQLDARRIATKRRKKTGGESRVHGAHRRTATRDQPDGLRFLRLFVAKNSATGFTGVAGQRRPSPDPDRPLLLRRRQMPLSADRAEISLPLSRKPQDCGGVERVALRAVAAFAHTHPLAFIARRFLHRTAKPGYRFSASAWRRIFASTTNGPAGSTLAMSTSAVRRHGQSYSSAAWIAAQT